jgi:uncharacterized protein (DUF58 family)
MLKSTIPDEIFRNIRRIQISTSRLVAELFAGEYKSVFKGKGLEFSEVREYQIGDDLRTIDWNVTARQGRPFVKRYIEERELTVMFLLDVSASTYFGTVKALKRDMAAEVAAILAASASTNNDKVGLIIFTDRIEKFIPPRKGRKHVMRVIREILYCEPEGKGTDIPMALQYLNKVTARSTISFLISDFYAGELKKPLLIANKRHDIIAVSVTDPRDRSLPDVGLLSIKDAETGKERVIDTSSTAVRGEYARLAEENIKARRSLLGSVSIDSIDVNPEITYSDALRRFFEVRKIRRGVAM